MKTVKFVRHILADDLVHGQGCETLSSISPLKFANANLYIKMTNLEKQYVCLYMEQFAIKQHKD
jgi:hypothetical protein